MRQLHCALACIVLLGALAACTEPLSSEPELEEVEASASAVEVETVAEPEAPAPLVVRNTADGLSVQLLERQFLPEGGSEPFVTLANVSPGGEEALNLSPQDLKYSAAISFQTEALQGTSALQDLFFTRGGNQEFVENSMLEFSGSADDGYRLLLYTEEEGESRIYQRYLLDTVQCKWIPYWDGQKLFLDDFDPGLLGELYPSAYNLLEEGFAFGPSMLLWCYEPLYDFQIIMSSYEYDEAAGAFQVVDHNTLFHANVLQPDEPVARAYVIPDVGIAAKFQFRDSEGIEYVYLAGMNGRGGDYGSAVLYPMASEAADEDTPPNNDLYNEPILTDHLAFTDGTGTLEPVILGAGDSFLDWSVGRVEASVLQTENDGEQLLTLDAHFEGTVTVQGKLILTGSEPLPDPCFYVDDTHLPLFPRAVGDERVIWFLFTNPEELDSLKQEYGAEIARCELVISGYTVSYAPMITTNQTTLVSVHVLN